MGETAQLDPVLLLQHVRQFDFPGELSNSLDVQVLVHWSSHWRKECLLAGLQSFRSQVKSHSVQIWLDQWIASTLHRTAMLHLPPLIDNADDWSRLREVKHAADDILKLWDPHSKVRFSQHRLCAILFDHEIAALTEAHSEVSSPAGKIRPHLQLLRKIPAYKADCYPPDHQQIDWVAVERFFASALTPAEEQRLLLY